MSAFQGPRDWGRLLTAMLTPFRADGTVNYDEVSRIATWLVDDMKNDGIVVSGTTGESPTLSEDEKIHILRLTLEAVGDRAAVVFGAGTYDTAESVDLTKAAEKNGAHGIMLVNPYYSRPGQDGLYAHFSTIAKSTGLPVMLYNIQPRSSINLDTPTLMSLIKNVPNIVAVKEASGNMAQIAEVCVQAPASFRVYSGDDGVTLPVMSLGGHGLVSVAAHVVGAELKEMIDAFPKDPAKATKIAKSLQPVIKALFSAPSPVPVKWALSMRGFECESVRLPLVELSEEQKAGIRGLLQPSTQAVAALA